MDQLRPIELKLVDELFGMSSGYVLDFSNSTFADFFRREVGLDIYDEAYAIYGTSKGKHLRAFLTISQPKAIAKALAALWEYRELDRIGAGQADTVVSAHLRLTAVVERLGGSPLPVYETQESMPAQTARAERKSAFTYMPLAALPEVAGRGTVVVMPASWQARISGPLK